MTLVIVMVILRYCSILIADVCSDYSSDSGRLLETVLVDYNLQFNSTVQCTVHIQCIVVSALANGTVQ